MGFEQDVVIGHKYTTEVFIGEKFLGEPVRGMAKTRLARSLNSSKKKLFFIFFFYLKTIFLKVIDYQFLKNTFNLYLPRFFCSLISTSFGSASPLQSGLCNNPPFILPIPPYPTLSYPILSYLSYLIPSYPTLSNIFYSV